jgi:hypothetical protein
MDLYTATDCVIMSNSYARYGGYEIVHSVKIVTHVASARVSSTEGYTHHISRSIRARCLEYTHVNSLRVSNRQDIQIIDRRSGAGQPLACPTDLHE